eukprot:402656_1
MINGLIISNNNSNNNNINEEHKSNDNNINEEHKSNDNNREDIPSRPRGNRQEPPPRRNNFEFHMFGTFGLFDIISEIFTATNRAYASEQDRMDDKISKGIMIFLLCFIFMILYGMI